MELNKSAWNKVSFGDVVKNIKTNCDAVAEGIEKFVAGEHLVTDDLRIRHWGNVQEEFLGPAFHRKFVKGQILYGSRRTYLRKVAVAGFDGVCANTTFVFESKPEKLLNDLLPFIIQTPSFTKHSIDNSKGSTNPFVNYKDIAKFTFLLPPKDEQEKILSIFQTLENSIEQAEEQEKNLRALAKRLIDGLMSDTPTFGNLLEDKELTKVKFADVTDCIEQHKKESLPLGLTRFVGLENIEPENFRISTWGNISDGTTFTKTFAKGDVLFGKRRSYLKKVAIAEFDGICSSDVLVFRAKENKMLAKLLPFYAASESFIQYAVNTSAGSLSPRTKWRDLANFELSIPDLRIQSKILEVFQQVQTTIEQTIEQKQTLKNLKFKLLNKILG